MDIPLGSSSCHCSRSNRKLEMLVFKEGGKLEDPEQNPRSKDEKQQPSQSRGTRSFRTHGRFAPSRFAAKCSPI